MSALYPTANRAADWMSRGDDFEEAKAVRQLIAEHQALTAERDELLAAAVKLVEDIELTDRAGSLAGYPAGSDEMIAMKEAIAKAKGGQP